MSLFGIGEAVQGLFNTAGIGLGQLFSVQNMKRQFELNKRLAQFQDDLNVKNYKHRYQWAREDLEAAGINPLYGINGTGAAGAGLATVSQPDTAGMINAIQNANPIKAGVEMANWIRDFNIKRAQEKKLNQEAETEKFNTQLKAYEAINSQLQSLQRKKELNWYDKQMMTQLERDRSEIIKNLSNATESQSRTTNIKQMTETERERTGVEKQAKEAAERSNQFYKDHPNWGAVATFFKEMQAATGAVGTAGKMVIDASTRGATKKRNFTRKTNIK